MNYFNKKKNQHNRISENMHDNDFHFHIYIYLNIVAPIFLLILHLYAELHLQAVHIRKPVFF